MKRIKSVTVLIFSVLTLLILTSCEPSCEPSQINTQYAGSFTEVECGSFSSGHYIIFVHNETGVYYMATDFIGSDGRKYCGGLTVLLNADGTPYTGK